MATPDELINEARAAAAAAQEQAKAKLDSAIQLSESGATEVFDHLDEWGLPIDEPFIDVPPFSPNVQLSDSFKTEYNTNLATIDEWIRDKMTGWMETYYPRLNPALASSEDAWLLSVINNGYSGIPAALEQAIWDRARSKELIEANRMEEVAVSQFAARGFDLPPGVLVDRGLQVQQEASNKSSTIARDLAIKQIEIAIDMTKLAITEITRLRLGMAQALASYISAWLAVPAAAADISKAKIDFQSRLWDSTAAYMNAQANVKRVLTEVQTTNQRADITVAVENSKLQNDSLTRTISASIKAAEMLATQAAAALGSQNTIVGSVINKAE